MFQEFGQVTPNIAMVNSYLVYIPMVFICFRSIKKTYPWCSFTFIVYIPSINGVIYSLYVCTPRKLRVFFLIMTGIIMVCSMLLFLGHEYWNDVVVELLVIPAWTKSELFKQRFEQLTVTFHFLVWKSPGASAGGCLHTRPPAHIMFCKPNLINYKNLIPFVLMRIL